MTKYKKYKIAVILPPRENYSPNKSGAIALCVQDFTSHSMFRDDIIIFGKNSNKPENELNYRGLSLNGRFYHSVSSAYIYHLRNQLKEVRPSLIEVHNRPSLACKLHKISLDIGAKLAIHFHNDPQTMEMAKTPAMRVKLLKICSVIYCVSNFIRQQFCDGLEGLVSQEELAKVSVLYNGLSLPEYKADKEKIILFVGRLAETKGGMLFAKSLQIALPQLPEWRAVIVGADRHQPTSKPNAYERELAEIMGTLGNKAECTGFISHSQAIKYYQKSTISVVPSLWNEPFGRTALESMAHGTALITTGTGGLAEVVGDAALLLANHTPENLAKKIVDLANNTELQQKLIKLGIKQSKNFLINDVTAKLDKIRSKILIA